MAKINRRPVGGGAEVAMAEAAAVSSAAVFWGVWMTCSFRWCGVSKGKVDKIWQQMFDAKQNITFNLFLVWGKIKAEELLFEGPVLLGICIFVGDFCISRSRKIMAQDLMRDRDLGCHSSESLGPDGM